MALIGRTQTGFPVRVSTDQGYQHDRLLESALGHALLWLSAKFQQESDSRSGGESNPKASRLDALKLIGSVDMGFTMLPN